MVLKSMDLPSFQECDFECGLKKCKNVLVFFLIKKKMNFFVDKMNKNEKRKAK